MTDHSKILYHETFTGATLGETMKEACPPLKTCNQSKIVTREGRENGRMTGSYIQRGQTGYGKFGYTVDPSGLESCVEGSEIWWSQEMYFPSDFVLHGDHGSVKWFRIGKLDIANNQNAGCVDAQIKNGSLDWRVNVEHIQNGPGWSTFENGEVELGVVQRFEIYCYLHSERGIVRMYRDGVLFGESIRPTLRVGDYVNRVLLCTYWNGGSPKDQSCGLGDISIAIKSPLRDDTPFLQSDGHGNLCLGHNDDSGPVDPPIDPPVPPVEPPVPPIEPPIEPPVPPVPPVVTPGENLVTTWVNDGVVYIKTELPVIVN